jgi:hypothetical protein
MIATDRSVTSITQRTPRRQGAKRAFRSGFADGDASRPRNVAEMKSDIGVWHLLPQAKFSLDGKTDELSRRVLLLSLQELL